MHVRAHTHTHTHTDIYIYILYIQGVPGVKVTTAGVTSLGDAESKTSYTHGSNSQRFWRYEFLKYRIHMATGSVVTQVGKCIQADGGHFEQFA